MVSLVSGLHGRLCWFPDLVRMKDYFVLEWIEHVAVYFGCSIISGEFDQDIHHNV